MLRNPRPLLDRTLLCLELERTPKNKQRAQVSRPRGSMTSQLPHPQVLLRLLPNHLGHPYHRLIECLLLSHQSKVNNRGPSTRNLKSVMAQADPWPVHLVLAFLRSRKRSQQMISIGRGEKCKQERLGSFSTLDQAATNLFPRTKRALGETTQLCALRQSCKDQIQATQWDLQSLHQHFKLTGLAAQMVHTGHAGAHRLTSVEEAGVLLVGCPLVDLISSRPSELSMAEEGRR